MDGQRRAVVRGLLAAPTLALGACVRSDNPSPHVGDISQLEQTAVARILRPASVAELSQHLAASRGPVSIGGARYSMGGQIASEGSLHVDMRSLADLVWLNESAKTVRVQAGMTWRELQTLIDPHQLSVRIMQSYSNFTIGGSVGVNCHGRYVGRGPLVNSVRALRLIDAKGEQHELSRDQQPELFGAVFGGYGGIGVVTEVELDLDANCRIERHAQRVALVDYPAFFREQVLGRADVVLHNADLQPPNFDQPLAISWIESEKPLTQPLRLVPRDLDYRRQQGLIWVASELPGSGLLRERSLTQSLLQESPIVWRNYEASLDARSLEPLTRAVSTYLLQEYFIPEGRFQQFAAAMARILIAHDVNALNVSIRHSPADSTSLLRWAHEDVFSFVVYYKQRTFQYDDSASGIWTRKLIDAALAHGGRYYLPYRLHATQAQFNRAYPEIEAFAELKRQVDPNYRFRNCLWDKYLSPAK